MQLLSTKLAFPSLRLRLVNRSRLFQRLNPEADCGFLLLSAPAGYGKTTLLNTWLTLSGYLATWISLDDRDNDPLRFLNYLAAALRKIRPSLAEVLDPFLNSSSLPEPEFFLTLLVNELAEVTTPFWLVLDDFHVIQNPVIHRGIDFLLEHRPPSFHLAIATRSDPPLMLSRLRARSQMIELRLNDLRFSNQEIQEFAATVIGMSLSDEDIVLLEKCTEGWVAGLQMAGLSLQGRRDISDYIRTFTGENRYILDFLFEEVFAQQPEEIQLFLLQTSILDQLCGPLCNTVTQREDSQLLLETLEKKNLFLISLDEQRKWYRYHHLFGDLLKSRLKRTMPGFVGDLHERASDWHAAQGDFEHAISHALSAGNFPLAAHLIEQAALRLDKQNQQGVLITWINQLPPIVLEAHPWLCVYRASGDYWAGHRGKEQTWLRMAEKALEENFEGGDSERRHIQGHIAAVQAHIAITNEDTPRILEMAQKALDLLPDMDEMRCQVAVALGAAYWAMGKVAESEQAFRSAKTVVLENHYPSMVVGPTCYAGIQQIKQGRLHQALITFQDGLRLATLPDGKENPIAGFPNVRIGDLWREWHNLAQAEYYLERGVEQCVQFGQPDVLLDAYVCFARWQWTTGNFEALQATLNRADWLAQQSKVDPFEVCWLDDIRLRTWLVNNDLDAALSWVNDRGLTPDGPLNYMHDLPHLNLARVLVAEGFLSRSRPSADTAASLLLRLRKAAENAGWVHEKIKILLLQACNDHARKMDKEALLALVEAVALAEPGGYIRIFVDEGKIMASLLDSLAAALKKEDQDISQYLGGFYQADVQGEEGYFDRLNLYISRLLAVFKNPGDQASQFKALLEHGVIPGLLAVSLHPSQPLVEPLSAREKEVLALLANGCSDKQIAESLVIARETVHKHLKNIYGKLGAHSRTEAVARARSAGIL